MKSKKRKKIAITMLFVISLVVMGCEKDANPYVVSDFGDVPEGAACGKFTINEAGDQVYFSKGNLQYQASTGTWRFAGVQYQCIGEANSNISSTYDGWIDLFGWGTSGWNNGNLYYQPYNSEYIYDSYDNGFGYGPLGDWNEMYQEYEYCNLTGKYANSDWGVYNPIINGGNRAGLWRTLTSDEWSFVLNARNTTSGIRYAMACVNNVNGMIILPDDWNSDYYDLYSNENGFNANIISNAQWTSLEQHGAVFLPAAGIRYKTDFNYLNLYGNYWSTTARLNYGGYFLWFNSTYFYPDEPNGSGERYIGKSVRLVQDIGGGSGNNPYPVDYSSLRLNELNGNDKFIEIYNAGGEIINMSGVNIYKDTDELVWTGNSTVNIEAGEYLILWSKKVLDDHEGLGPIYFFSSSLSAEKNVRIELKTPAGEEIDDFNLVDIEQNAPEYIPYSGSYSRNADGNWYYAEATPGTVNVDGEVAVLGLLGGHTPEPPTPGATDYTNLMLNELNGNTKFIEFYNKGDQDLSLQGLYLEKDDNIEPIWTGDGTLTVPAHSYLVLYSLDVVADHPELEGTNYIFNSGLSNKKTIRFALFLADGTQLDIFTRGSTGEWGQTISAVYSSYARTPDAGDWKLADPTPGEANPETGDPIPEE